MTTTRVAPKDRLSAARLWLPVIRELEARLPSRVDVLCGRIGVRREAFEDPRGRIALGAATKLLREATRETRDPIFGLLAGRRHARESYDVFMRMLLVQPDFESAIGVAQRFSSLPIEGLEVSYLPEGGLLRVVMALDGEPMTPPFLAEYLVGLITELVTVADDARMRVLEVEVAHSPLADRRAYREALGAEVRFESARTAIVLPNVNIPLRNADPLLATLLADHAEAVLESLSPTSGYRDRVAGFVEARLDERLGIEAVASAFGMSPRTLRRRLDEEGTTFATVLDDTRRTRALALLRDDQRSVAEVSVAIGFASPGAFRRAFQRWTGTSASRYRGDTEE
jgi:AraC-like DNA-binding protein